MIIEIFSCKCNVSGTTQVQGDGHSCKETNTLVTDKHATFRSSMSCHTNKFWTIHVTDSPSNGSCTTFTVLTVTFELLFGSFCPRLMKLKGVHVSCRSNCSGQRMCERPTACPTFQHCKKSEESSPGARTAVCDECKQALVVPTQPGLSSRNVHIMLISAT